jgi:hypothetical protein
LSPAPSSSPSYSMHARGKPHSPLVLWMP